MIFELRCPRSLLCPFLAPPTSFHRIYCHHISGCNCRVVSRIKRRFSRETHENFQIVAYRPELQNKILHRKGCLCWLFFTSPCKDHFWYSRCFGATCLLQDSCCYGVTCLAQDSTRSSSLSWWSFLSLQHKPGFHQRQPTLPCNWELPSHISLCLFLLLHKQNFHPNISKGVWLDQEVSSQLFLPP